jgi:hypothetical protein
LQGTNTSYPCPRGIRESSFGDSTAKHKDWTTHPCSRDGCVRPLTVANRSHSYVMTRRPLVSGKTRAYPRQPLVRDCLGKGVIRLAPFRVLHLRTKCWLRGRTCELNAAEKRHTRHTRDPLAILRKREHKGHTRHTQDTQDAQDTQDTHKTHKAHPHHLKKSHALNIKYVYAKSCGHTVVTKTSGNFTQKGHKTHKTQGTQGTQDTQDTRHAQDTPTIYRKRGHNTRHTRILSDTLAGWKG